jgi:uncharacterized membrane protein YgcG
MSEKPAALKPIMLYDHLPGILAIYPSVLFAILAILSAFRKNASSLSEDVFTELKAMQEKLGPEAAGQISLTEPFFNAHMLFWIGLSVMLVWYVAFRFNMPKSKFLLMFGLLGTFVGIPVVLELSGYIRPFSWTSQILGHLEPTMNTGAWIVLSLVFFVIFAANYVYSRTHMRVRIDESGLTVNRLGGKGERFELIGLKTENEPLDYLELFLAGVGSLSLKTRMNKPIFSMKRVMGLYRVPWFPFFKGKLARIEEMLSYQGKVVSVGREDQLDVAEMMDTEQDDMGDDGDDGDFGGDFDGGGADETGSGSEMK